MTRGTRALIVLLLGAVGLALGGVASAYWGGTGSGNGTAATATTVAVTLSPATPATTLYPGGVSDVELTISNPNASPVRLGSLALDTAEGTGGFTVDTGHAGCAVATLSFTSQTNGGSGWTAPAKAGGVDGTLSVSLTNALAMGANAASACQGASFTVYLAASP